MQIRVGWWQIIQPFSFIKVLTLNWIALSGMLYLRLLKKERQGNHCEHSITSAPSIQKSLDNYHILLEKTFSRNIQIKRSLVPYFNCICLTGNSKTQFTHNRNCIKVIADVLAMHLRHGIARMEKLRILATIPSVFCGNATIHLREVISSRIAKFISLLLLLLLLFYTSFLSTF